MKVFKIKDVIKDWIAGGYQFGRTISNYVADRLEASPKGARIGTTAFDTVAGAGLTYWGVTGAVGAVLGGIAAATTLFYAPGALVALALAPVWLTLSLVTTAAGVGMLDSARRKMGIEKKSDIGPKARAYGAEAKGALHDLIQKGKKAGQDFKAAAEQDNKPEAKAAEPKPAPKNNAPRP